MATKSESFEDINQSIVDDLINELRLQGHHLTGALEASIKQREIIENGQRILTASAAEYLEDLEKGVPGNEIVIDTKSLAEMTRYVELRMGYRGKLAQNVAYQILKKQQKEGMPTLSSYQYSKTGERTAVVSETFSKNESTYGQSIDNRVVESIDGQFNQIKSGVV